MTLALPATRAAIALLIPHQGAMCLLERVMACDADSIACESDTHRDFANPLRRDGILPMVCGLEYALQAMALHGALTTGGVAQKPGYLSALRGVRIGAARLDTVAGALRIAATLVAAEARGFIYRFEIIGAADALLSGQATIIIPEAP